MSSKEAAVLAVALPALIVNPLQGYEADRNISEAEITDLQGFTHTMLEQYRQGPKVTVDWFTSMTPEQLAYCSEHINRIGEVFNRLASVEPQQVAGDAPDGLEELMKQIGAFNGSDD